VDSADKVAPRVGASPVLGIRSLPDFASHRNYCGYLVAMVELAVRLRETMRHGQQQLGKLLQGSKKQAEFSLAW
jgi:hypothetical protein